jgi:PUB domain
MLDRIVANVLQSPQNQKYWTVRRHNPVYERSIGSVPDLESLLQAAGFVLQRDDTWAWQCHNLSRAQHVHDELQKTLADACIC